MIDFNTIVQATPQERGNMILGEIANINALDELQQAEAISQVINIFIDPYIRLKVREDSQSPNGSILTLNNLGNAFDIEIARFLPFAINAMRSDIPTTDSLVQSSKNIYEMSGSVQLSFANKVTRNISTTTGLLWERLASISPYAINPEQEFNLKIKGIDLISLNINTNDIEYQQLKTQRNTLTGSQKARSVSELSLHNHPVFCACFTNNSSWTFNHGTIPRVSGDEFWSRIGISYPLFLVKASELILRLEEEYISLL